MSWPRIAGSGTPNTAVTTPPPSGTGRSTATPRRVHRQDLVLGQGTGRIGLCPVGFLPRHHLDHLVIVPRVLRLRRGFHLHDVHGVHHQSVGAYVSVLGEHVVDLDLLELCHDQVRIGRPYRLDRVQIL